MTDARVHEPLLDDRGRSCLLNPLCSIPLAARSLDLREESGEAFAPLLVAQGGAAPAGR